MTCIHALITFPTENISHLVTLNSCKGLDFHLQVFMVFTVHTIECTYIYVVARFIRIGESSIETGNENSTTLDV